MQIMITRRCNMKCSHCCYSCTENGSDMSFETFKKAVTACEELNDRVGLCGGEPTVHPLFWDFLSYGMKSNARDVFVCTNGKLTEDALYLADLGRRGKIRAELSIDRWHEAIDPEVVKAFETSGRFGDNRGIRRVDRFDDGASPQKAGRATEGANLCPCEGACFVDTDGQIYPCGCEDAPVMGDIGDMKFVKTLHKREWLCFNESRRWAGWKERILQSC